MHPSWKLIMYYIKRKKIGGEKKEIERDKERDRERDRDRERFFLTLRTVIFFWMVLISFVFLFISSKQNSVVTFTSSMS
jgi:hypothetical protein